MFQFVVKMTSLIDRQRQLRAKWEHRALASTPVRTKSSGDVIAAIEQEIKVSFAQDQGYFHQSDGF